MNDIATKPRQRCAVYCRVSSDERLAQEFNSIDAQKEAGQAFIVSQRPEGWIAVAHDYDDPGFSGGNTERPGLKRLMADIERGQIDIVVVYKIDRLTRSLADFSKMVDGVGSSMFFMMALCSCNHHNGESKLPKWRVKQSHAG